MEDRQTCSGQHPPGGLTEYKYNVGRWSPWPGESLTPCHTWPSSQERLSTLDTPLTLSHTEDRWATFYWFIIKLLILKSPVKSSWQLPPSLLPSLSRFYKFSHLYFFINDYGAQQRTSPGCLSGFLLFKLKASRDTKLNFWEIIRENSTKFILFWDICCN